MRFFDRDPNRAPRRARGVLARLVLTMALVVGLGAGGAATPAAAYDEDTIVALANDARAQNGLGGLVRNGSLDAVALTWANQMAANGSISHNPAYGSQIPGGWRAAGENVAQGYGSGAGFHNGWMASAPHRANILGDFTDIGTALIEANGTTWAVQVFANYPGSGLPAPAPPAPAPAAPEQAPAAPAPATPADPAADAAAAAAAADASAAEAAEAAAAAAESAATATPSPAPSARHAMTSAPTPGPQASESSPISGPAPWIGAGVLLLVLASAVLAWFVARLLVRRGRRRAAGPHV
jgi:hypothetical protein